MVEINGSVINIKRVDDPGGAVLRVVASRLRHCPEEIDAGKLSPDQDSLMNDCEEPPVAFPRL